MSFLKEGKIKEVEASSLFKNVIFSNKETDINEHWDFKSEGIKYDVKGLKRINRDDTMTNEFYHFIEIKNVKGKLGWLYGEADYFIFETNRYWVIVSKLHLQEFIKDNVTKTYVNSPDEALYCLYKRDKRQDVITLVTTIDLLFLATSIRPKREIIKHNIGHSIYPDKALNQRIKNIFKK